jgi:hypothetical protein
MHDTSDLFSWEVPSVDTFIKTGRLILRSPLSMEPNAMALEAMDEVEYLLESVAANYSTFYHVFFNWGVTTNADFLKLTKANMDAIMIHLKSAGAKPLHLQNIFAAWASMQPAEVSDDDDDDVSLPPPLSDAFVAPAPLLPPVLAAVAVPMPSTESAVPAMGPVALDAGNTSIPSTEYAAGAVGMWF